MTDPKVTSRLAPRISSVEFISETIGCTVTPSIAAWGNADIDDAVIRSKLFLTSSSICRLSATPPASVLCVMSGEYILSTTGYPISRAAAAASSGVLANTVRATGIP